jgi:hypothetical protein
MQRQHQSVCFNLETSRFNFFHFVYFVYFVYFVCFVVE